MLAIEPSSHQWLNFIQTVSGFRTRPNTAELETAIEQFLWLNLPRNLQASILRFGATNGELDVSSTHVLLYQVADALCPPLF